jgi:hypothetical protein
MDDDRDRLVASLVRPALDPESVGEDEVLVERSGHDHDGGTDLVRPVHGPRPV